MPSTLSGSAKLTEDTVCASLKRLGAEPLKELRKKARGIGPSRAYLQGSLGTSGAHKSTLERVCVERKPARCTHSSSRHLDTYDARL